MLQQTQLELNSKVLDFRFPQHLPHRILCDIVGEKEQATWAELWGCWNMTRVSDKRKFFWKWEKNWVNSLRIINIIWCCCCCCSFIIVKPWIIIIFIIVKKKLPTFTYFLSFQKITFYLEFPKRLHRKWIEIKWNYILLITLKLSWAFIMLHE